MAEQLPSWMDYFAPVEAAPVAAASAGWESFFQGLASTVVGGYAQTQNNAFELEKAKINYLGQNGYYAEGQPTRNGSVGGINSGTLLLIAAALAVYLLVKD